MTAVAEKESTEAAEIRWYYAQGKRAQNPDGVRTHPDPEDFVPMQQARREDYARARRIYRSLMKVDLVPRAYLFWAYGEPRRFPPEIGKYFGDDLLPFIVRSLRASTAYGKRPEVQKALSLEEWLCRVVATGKITTVVRTHEGLSRVGELRAVLRDEAREALDYALGEYRTVRIRPPRGERPIVPEAPKRKPPRRRDVTRDFR